MKANKQQGFTIIELVVVILLLGILTATALPRFMNVTDEAHQAVVDGVLGGLTSGLAMYRAEWYAEGQPGEGNTVGYGLGTMMVNSVGYPIGLDTPFDSSDDCANIYAGLLQASGRPTIATITGGAVALNSGVYTAGQATADFLAYADLTNDICEFAYTSQFQDPSTGTVQVIRMNQDGSIAQGVLP